MQAQFQPRRAFAGVRLSPFLWGPRPLVPVGKASRDRLGQAQAVAIFVSGERRRPTEAPKPAALWPTSPRDRIQEIQGGPQWEGRREGGGGKGAAAAAAHTGSVLGAARTEGGSAGEAVPSRTPVGACGRTDGQAEELGATARVR